MQKKKQKIMLYLVYNKNGKNLRNKNSLWFIFSLRFLLYISFSCFFFWLFLSTATATTMPTTSSSFSILLILSLSHLPMCIQILYRYFVFFITVVLDLAGAIYSDIILHIVLYILLYYYYTSLPCSQSYYNFALCTIIN